MASGAKALLGAERDGGAEAPPFRLLIPKRILFVARSKKKGAGSR